MAKYMKTEEGYQAIETTVLPTVDAITNNKMDKTNPAGTGSFSMGRKSGSLVGESSHAEGYNTVASGNSSHAEGTNTKANGDFSHAEGSSTIAMGTYSHAEGSNAKATAEASHSEGRSTTAAGRYSHAEGYNTVASGNSSHAEGANTKANGDFSHAEGSSTIAMGTYSHAEGIYTGAHGNYSHTEGYHTAARSDYQHSQGKYNIEDNLNKYAHIVGNGTSDSAHSNAHTLDWSGNAWFAGDVYVGSTSGTNKDDGSKKLATEDYVNNNVDATLTKSGQAADAKATGDGLRSLSEEIVTTAASQVSAHNTGTDTHSDIRLLISGLTDRLNALADSDDTTLDQLSEVVAYIKSNRELISAITTDKVSVADIIDNLTTNIANKPLSAAQGVALKALIDAITVPDKLPNPNALTFTGAVTGSYDGSEPLTVEIPSGGSGGSDAWNLIDHFTAADAAISYAIPLQPGAKEYGIYWVYTNDKAPQRSIYVDNSLAEWGVMYRCLTNEMLFVRVYKGPSNILATGQGIGYGAQRFSNGGTNIGSGTDFPAMTLATNIACTTSEIWVYWR